MIIVSNLLLLLVKNDLPVNGFVTPTTTTTITTTTTPTIISTPKLFSLSQSQLTRSRPTNILSNERSVTAGRISFSSSSSSSSHTGVTRLNLAIPATPTIAANTNTIARRSNFGRSRYQFVPSSSSSFSKRISTSATKTTTSTTTTTTQLQVINPSTTTAATAVVATSIGAIAGAISGGFFAGGLHAVAGMFLFCFVFCIIIHQFLLYCSCCCCVYQISIWCNYFNKTTKRLVC
jgi:hypothetical protein